MKTKNIIALLLPVLLLGFVGFASAANNTTANVTIGPGNVTPISDSNPYVAPPVANTTDLNLTLNGSSAGVAPGQFFYGFDKLFDRVKFALASGPEAKANVGLNIASERLAEAEALAAQGKVNLSQEAMAQHNLYLNQVEQKIQQMSQTNNTNQSLAAIQAMTRVQLNLEKHQELINQAKVNFLNSHPNLTQSQINAANQVFDNMTNQSLQSVDRNQQKIQNETEHYKEIANLTEKESEDLAKNISQQEGLAKFQEQQKAMAEARFQTEVQVRQANLEKLKQMYNETNMTEQQKIQFEARIQAEQQNLEQFKQQKELLQEQMQKLAEAQRNMYQNASEYSNNSQEYAQQLQEKAREALSHAYENQMNTSGDSVDNHSSSESQQSSDSHQSSGDN